MTSKQVFDLQKMNLKRQQRVQKKKKRENREFRKKKKHESICVEVDENYNTQIDPEFVHNKLTDLEDRLRRNNLRICRVTETNETWEK